MFDLGPLLDEINKCAEQKSLPEINKCAEQESFFPDPKATFTIDRPKVKCSICQETPLGLSRVSARARPTQTAMLPCGHAACHGCLSTWLEVHATCPFCRVEHRHARCGHAVAPRALTFDAILALPPTTCRGGAAAARCPDCRRRRLDAAARHYKSVLGDARAVSAATSAARARELAEAIAEVRRAKSEFVRVLSDHQAAGSHLMW